MPSFGNTSTTRIETCHPLLQKLFQYVVKEYDCSVICGHRPENEQDAAFSSGNSTVEWPNSKHNSNPSEGIDVAPYPIDWEDMARFYHFAGYVQATADKLNIKVRWGGDWDGDKQFKDQTFNDLVHWELLR